MPQPRQAFPHRRQPIAAALLVAALTGCANPGPPKAPSLHLPKPVRDLTVARNGSTVEVHFTVPNRSTDELPLKAVTLTATLCRQLPKQPCVPAADHLTVPTNGAAAATWQDHLPADLAAGPPRLLAYRLTLSTPSGRNAGPSAPAFTAAGEAPPPVAGLQPTGTRQGTLLRWAAAETPAGTQTLLQRKNPATNEKNSLLWLNSNATAAETLDTTAKPDIAYQYIAVRQQHLTLDGHAIDLRSDESQPITFTLRNIYPPSTPTGLIAAASTVDGKYGIDLIWQPVDDRALGGYNVYRQPLNNAEAKREKLNNSLVTVPGFHDATADAQTHYRYSVTAVGLNNAESDAATTELEP